ncbi:MAG: glycosyltransferase family 39 protein [Verrucomicrobiota bacterium JB023]|nr:glycosyltransferase family 39 protein [Verrucomicrobiota bacterium JB023]
MTTNSTRFFLFWLGGITLLRLLWHLLLNPVGIMGDEAYNWDWGRHLAWGYYSKPPGSAWLHGLVNALSGGSLFAIKATSTLLAGLSTLFFYLTLRHLFGQRFAFWTGLLYLLAPGQLVVSSILTADAQLLCYWNLSLFAAVRILFPKEAAPPGWAWAVLFVALALGHLAKQMMLVNIVLFLLATLLIRPALLRNPLTYLVPVLSLISLVPPLYWNSQHDWITFQHTAHHFEPDKFEIGGILERFGVLALLTAVLLNPLALAAIPMSLRRWISEKRAIAPKFLFLILYGPLPFAVMFLMTFRQDVNPNWPGAYHGGTLACAASLFLLTDPRANVRGKLFKFALIFPAALTTLVLLAFPLAETLFKVIPAARAQNRTAWGFPELAREVASHDPDRRHAIILHGHRDVASQLAFNMPGQPEVHVWNEKPTINHQYDFWAGPEPGQPALVVIARKKKTSRGTPSEVMLQHLGPLEYLAEYDLHPSREYPRFRVYRTPSVTSWPSPVPGSRRGIEP